MWLMIRVLQDQEEHFIDSDDNKLFFLEKGVRASVGRNKFASYCSGKSILYAFFPIWIRKWFRPKTVSDYAKQTPNTKKMRSIYSLIDTAQRCGYVDYGKKKTKSGNIEEVRDRIIRVSEKGDEFCSYFEGLELLIKKYPRLWGIIGLSLIPWLYTNRDWAIKILHFFN